MKKRIIALLIAVVAAFVFNGCSLSNVAGGDHDDSGTNSIDAIRADEMVYGRADLTCLNGKKIGITVQSLQNTYWAGVMSALQDVLNQAGANATIISCNNNSATQISQIENFTVSGCDLIMVHPENADAIESVCADARAAGVKVMCWDDPMKNTDANWILDNTALGREIGKMAADFINKHFSEDNPAEVLVIGYPQTVVLLERENGIKAGLRENAAGKFTIVATQAGLVSSEAQTAVETTLQAHPNLKVVVGIGAGSMIGADEALNIATAGKIPEDMGVFTTDATKQQLYHLCDSSYPAKGIIGFEGSDVDTATCCADMFALTLSEQLEKQNVYRSVMRITEDTAAKIIGDMK